MTPGPVHRPSHRVRWLGALIGGGFGAALLGLIAASATWYGGVAQYLCGVLVLILGGALGWLLAPRAVAPGIPNAAITAGNVTALAVPLGALLFPLLLMLSRVAESGSGYLAEFSVPDLVGGVVAMAYLGLWVFGLPLAGLTFVMASTWVVLVRLAHAGLRAGHAGAAPESSAGDPA